MKNSFVYFVVLAMVSILIGGVFQSEAGYFDPPAQTFSLNIGHTIQTLALKTLFGGAEILWLLMGIGTLLLGLIKPTKKKQASRLMFQTF